MNNRIQAMDAKDHWIKVIGEYGVYFHSDKEYWNDTKVSPLRLLTNHLLIHMGQSGSHHLNQVIKLSLTNRGTWFAS